MSQRAGKRLRAAGALLALLALVLAVLWATVPAWVPLAVERTLPPGWHVSVLETSRPGLAAIHIGELALRREAADLVVEVEARDLSLVYAGPAVDIGRLRLRYLNRSDATDDTGFDWSTPQSYSLPELSLPHSLPAVRIGQLLLDIDTSSARHSLELTRLRSFSGPGRWGVTAQLERHPYLDSALDLRLRASAGELQFEFTPVGAAQSASAIILREAGDGGDGEGAARLEFDISLAAFTPAALGNLLQGMELGEPAHLGGRLSGKALFRGESDRQLHSVELAFEELAAQSSAASLALNAALDASLRDGQVDWRIRTLDLDADIGGDIWPRILRGTLERAAVSLQPLGPRLRVVVSAPAPISGEFVTAAPYPSRINGDLALDVRTPDALSLTLQLEGIALRADALHAPEDMSVSAEARGILDVNVPLRIGTADLEAAVDDARAEFEGAFHLQGGAVDSLDIRTLDVRGDGLSLAAADGEPLLLADGLRFRAQTTKGGGVRVNGSGELVRPRLPPADLRMQRLDLRFESFALFEGSGRFNVTTSGMEVTAGESTYSGFEIDARGDLSGGTLIAGSGKLLFGAAGMLPFAYESDLAAGAAEMMLDAVSLPVAELAAAAPALGLPLPQNFAVSGGSLLLDGRLRLPGADGPAPQGWLDARAEKIAFSLGESRTRDLGFTTRFELGENIKGGGPVTVGRAQLAAGIEVEGLSTRLDMDGASDLGIVDLRAKLLDGQLETDALRLVQGELADSLLHWHGFELERLLAVLDVGGLAGSGVLDASLPLVREGGGLAVRDGSLSARGPGRIRYRPDIPASNIGLQALQNFHYQSLEGRINYAGGSGAYTISLELRGNNPDLYGGHPVHLNLTIGGSMPALFRSLFLTGNFERAIINQLKSGEVPPPD